MPRIKTPSIDSIEKTVQKILRDVERGGDRALFRYTRQYDRQRLTARTIEVSPREQNTASKKLGRLEIRALEKAAARIRKFHERQKSSSWRQTEGGLRLELRWTPLERVGIYVPGGRASYPSTVLMNAIPASVAGVKEILMTTPFPDGRGDPATLVAAKIAGVNRIFKVGGAQAIAAFAYGTRSIPKADKIVGPGNRFVAEAKRQVFGQVGIDMIAGPTELVILADDSANPLWIAADLISQAEHDPDARPIIISPSTSLLRKVREEVQERVPMVDRHQITAAAFKKGGKSLKVRNLREGCERVNEIAPEHLELHVRNPRKILLQIRNAGAIFLGPYSPVTIGDYAAGPNHVLPTAGAARFSSPLGVYDFQKASSVIEATPAGLKRIAPLVITLARMEGLTSHAASVEIRMRKRNAS